jgi:hypothetical protein
MSDKKKVVGKPFKKGQSGNPGGLTPLAKELRSARRLTKEKFIDLVSLMNGASHEEMQRILGNPETTALTMMVIKVYMQIIETGNMKDFDVLLNRLIGKVKDETEHTGTLTIQKLDGSGIVLGTGNDEGEEEG